MNVKIELAKNLDKSINSLMESKKFPKLSTKDIFEKWSRNLKTELNIGPLCSGRFDKGPLKHPRLESNAKRNIFVDENQYTNPTVA